MRQLLLIPWLCLFAVSLYAQEHEELGPESYRGHVHDHDHDHAHERSSITPLFCPDMGITPGVIATWTPDTASVANCGSWVLRITNDTADLDPGTRIKISAPRSIGTLQMMDPSSEGYVSLGASSGSAVWNLDAVLTGKSDDAVIWERDKDAWVVTISIDGSGGQWMLGDYVEVVLGGSGGGEACMNRVSYDAKAKIAWAPNGSGSFNQLQANPEIYVNPAIGVTSAAYTHMGAKPGQPQKVKTIIYDAYYNRAHRFVGGFSVSCTDPAAVYPSNIYFSAADSGRLEFDITFNTEGIHYITFNSLSPDFPKFNSHAVRVSAGQDPGIFWGEFHTHSEYSRDAAGQPGWDVARYVGNLDYFAPTEHSHNNGNTPGLTCLEWEDYVDRANAINEPGDFVTFLGYETSFHMTDGGHHNEVFYFNDSEAELVPVLWEATNVPGVWSDADALMSGSVRMISIPHHTGKWFDNADSGRLAAVNFGPAYEHPEYRRLIEIYSTHGLSELYDPTDILAYETESSGPRVESVDGPHYAQDAWALGERLGVIACSDDHSGRGGVPRLGVMATFAPKLDRAEVFEGMYNRNTYGTTGDRIFLDFRADGALMGSILHVDSGHVPHLEAEVYGTEDLLDIWLLKWDMNSGTYVGGHPKFDTLLHVSPGELMDTITFDDFAFSDSVLYYVKVRQPSRHHGSGYGYAWSSPIWFLEADCPAPANPKATILDPSLGRVQLSWDAVPGATNYQICGKYAGETEYLACLKRNATSQTISALDTNRTWQWQVRARCGSVGSVSSEFTPLQSWNFTTESVARESGPSNIRIYPNPADQLLRIETGDPESVVRLFDSMGREVTAARTDLDGAIWLQTSEYNDGIYFIVLEQDSQVETRTIHISH